MLARSVDQYGDGLPAGLATRSTAPTHCQARFSAVISRARHFAIARTSEEAYSPASFSVSVSVRAPAWSRCVEVG